MADSFSSAPSALGEGLVKPSKYRMVPDQESTTMLQEQNLARAGHLTGRQSLANKNMDGSQAQQYPL
jgi:hypothetical protein